MRAPPAVLPLHHKGNLRGEPQHGREAARLSQSAEGYKHTRNIPPPPQSESKRAPRVKYNDDIFLQKRTTIYLQECTCPKSTEEVMPMYVKCICTTNMQSHPKTLGNSPHLFILRIFCPRISILHIPKNNIRLKVSTKTELKIKTLNINLFS